MTYIPESHRRTELSRYRARRAEAIALLGGRCAWCGSIDDLEFDHVDPSQKSFDVSAFWSVSRPRLLGELQKCQLLCRPHHRVKTKTDCQNLAGGLKHNRWRYLKHRCRCAECRADYSIYRRERYAAAKR